MCGVGVFMCVVLVCVDGVCWSSFWKVRLITLVLPIVLVMMVVMSLEGLIVLSSCGK